MCICTRMHVCVGVRQYVQLTMRVCDFRATHYFSRNVNTRQNDKNARQLTQSEYYAAKQ